MSGFLHTNLHCLALVARHHGVDLAPERLQHDYAVGNDPVAVRQLLRMAKDAGLRARHLDLTWRGLFQLGEAFPVLAELTNGNWVVIAGAIGEGEDERRGWVRWAGEWVVAGAFLVFLVAMAAERRAGRAGRAAAEAGRTVAEVAEALGGLGQWWWEESCVP